MQIKSTSFLDNQPLPPRHTCAGEGLSPPFNITGVPKNAKSLALIAHDPDAVNGDFAHWLVWDIDPTTTHLVEGASPSASIEGTNDFGDIGYGAPCPPAGTGAHRYVFELYALDTVAELPPISAYADLQKTIAAHTLAKASLTGVAHA